MVRVFSFTAIRCFDFSDSKHSILHFSSPDKAKVILGVSVLKEMLSKSSAISWIFVSRVWGSIDTKISIYHIHPGWAVLLFCP